MSAHTPRPAVQESYPDTRVAGQPGQLADMRSVGRDPIGSYTTQTAVYVGRAVVCGAISVDPFDLHEYGVKAPEPTSLATDLMGIVAYTYATELDAEGHAYVSDNSLAGVIEPGMNVLVYVLIPTASVIAPRDKVYVAVQPDNAAAIPIGAFANQAGEGLVEWPLATWHKQVGPQLAVIKL